MPLALLIVDFVARLAMVDVRKAFKANNSYEGAPVQNSAEVDRDEDSPLLEADPCDGRQSSDEVKTSTPQGFWNVMLRQGSVYAAIANVIAFSILVSGFDATLPLHLRDAFGWTSAPIGSIFLALQIPGMFLSPFVGWLRDRIGLRWPTTLGWGLTAPLLWFIGVPGPDNFLGVGAGSGGQAAFISCMVGIGIVLSFARGAGTFQLTSELTLPCFS